MATSPSDEELLTPAEVAEEWGVPEKTLRNWRHIGRGPAYVRVSGKHIRYRRSDLQRFADAQTVTPGAA